MEQFKAQVEPPLSLIAQSHFFLPSPNKTFRLLCSTKKPDLQLVDQKFLGNYEAMFNHPMFHHPSNLHGKHSTGCSGMWDSHV